MNLIDNRVLVLGAGGQLGHMLVRILKEDFEVFGTTRGSTSTDQPLTNFIDEKMWIPDLDVTNLADLEKVITELRPEAVINCVGIVKQRHEMGADPVSYWVNAVLPHEISKLVTASGGRFIHFSTDCVFSGKDGNYSETDAPDPTDDYGSSKHEGEVTNTNSLTLRTSHIGPELTTHQGLYDWVLRSRGMSVSGFTNAIFSGFTTLELSIIVKQIITNHQSLHGIFQVASEPISKYELIRQLNVALNLGIDVIPNGSFHCDRSLNGSRFKDATGIRIPSWPEMIEALAQDQGAYAGVGA